MVLPIVYAGGALALRFAAWAAPVVGRAMFGSVPRVAATALTTDIALFDSEGTRRVLSGAFNWTMGSTASAAEGILSSALDNPAKTAGMVGAAATVMMLAQNIIGTPLALVAGIAVAAYFNPQIGQMMQQLVGAITPENPGQIENSSEAYTEALRELNSSDALLGLNSSEAYTEALRELSILSHPRSGVYTPS